MYNECTLIPRFSGNSAHAQNSDLGTRLSQEYGMHEFVSETNVSLDATCMTCVVTYIHAVRKLEVLVKTVAF